MPQVRIDGLGTAGDGIARLDTGEVVFVDDALPGDVVEIRLTHKVKKLQRAAVVKVVEPSPQRVESRCPVAECGGCVVRGFADDGQLDAKRQRVVQALRRIAQQDVEEMLGEVVRDGDGWRYRHRVRLHSFWFDGRWHLGYHARRSHRLVPLQTCPVLAPELEVAALALAAAVADLPRHVELGDIELMLSNRDGRVAARIVAGGTGGGLREPLDWFERAGLAGVEVSTPKETWRHGDLVLRYDHRRADEFDLLAEPGVFTQANPGINEHLVAGVLRMLPANEAARVLELHAGVGNFSLPLARCGAIVFTAEHQKIAVELAQRNAAAAQVNLHAFFLNDMEALTSGGPVPPLSDFDAVLMNPPRLGAFEVAKRLAAAGPERIVYVSCDPATLARDVRTLVAGGYGVRNIEAFDMFPQTPHVEILLELRRT